MAGSEPSFGLPPNWEKIPEEEKKALQRPLIFPNHQKLFRRFTIGATVAMTIFMVFFHEYKQEDHVFQPIRHWVARQKANFFTLNPEELKYVEDRKQEMKKE